MKDVGLDGFDGPEGEGVKEDETGGREVCWANGFDSRERFLLVMTLLRARVWSIAVYMR